MNSQLSIYTLEFQVFDMGTSCKTKSPSSRGKYIINQIPKTEKSMKTLAP